MKQKDIIMEAKSTTYDTLPERIDYLISEIGEVKELLMQRIEKPEEIPKYLSLEQALLYLEKKGFLVSKSKLYKMTSGDIIPCHKNGNRIYFLPEELNAHVQALMKMSQKVPEKPIPFRPESNK